MSKNLKKLVKRLKAGLHASDLTHPINYPKAMAFVNRKKENE